MYKRNSLIEMRKEAVKALSASENPQKYIKENAETLFGLDLTMYTKNYTLNSLFYNAISASKLDENISLHPDQYKVLNLLENTSGVILSAPTSFGKTFVVFEYIARHLPKTVFLVVPTLALIDEYKRKIIRKYKNKFSSYKIFTTINNETDYSEYEYKMFIVTHDRVLEEATFEQIENIDFLVVDEVYKLDRKGTDDRKLILNFAYYYLVKKSEKHILLAPFISNIDNIDQLEKHPELFVSKFSPVVNEVIECDIFVNTPEARFKEAVRILNKISDEERTLVYFANASDIPKFVNKLDENEFDVYSAGEQVVTFISWLSEEIHPEWYVVKAMNKGYLVHSGDLQLGIRNMELDIFEQDEEPFNTMLCTSTLLEGVNTSTENIIITKPARSYTNISSNDFEAFDFFNLVGRSGRLFKTNLGRAYYIKAPNDKSYIIEDAVKSIEFEITSENIDVKIQKSTCTDEEYLNFLKVLNCSQEEYLSVIGYSSFYKVKKLYLSYACRREKLLQSIDALINNPKRTSRASLVYQLLLIFNDKNVDYDRYLNYRANIINLIINKNRLSIKKIVDETLKNIGTFNRTLDQVISDVMKTKNSYIEYDFSKCLNIILFFMKQGNVDHKYISYIVDNILNNINFLYYKTEPIKRILKESGIYDRDIDTVYDYVKHCSEDVTEIREVLKQEYNKYKDSISFLSRYSINRM